MRLTRVGDRSITQVGKDLDLTESARREWIQRDEAEAAPPSPEALTPSEREELMRRRKAPARLSADARLAAQIAGGHRRSRSRGTSAARACGRSCAPRACA